MFSKLILYLRKDTIVSFLLFSLAFIVRFLFISKGPFHLDALELAQRAQETLMTFNIHYMHASGYPLTVASGSLVIFLMRLLGINDPVFSVNFMSVVFGSLNITLLYLFSRKIIGQTGALISALILFFLPLHISVSTFGMTHPVSIFFHLAGAYLLFLYFEKYKLNRLILSAMFFGLGAAARLTDAVVIIAVLFIYIALSFKNFKVIRTPAIIYRLILFLISYSLVILLFYLPMFIKIGLAQFKDAVSIYYFFHSLNYLVSSLRSLYFIFGIPLLIIFISGAVCFFLEKSKVLFIFFLLWFSILFMYYGSTSIAEPRYLTLGLLPFFIMQGYFISRMSSIFKRSGFLLVLLTIVILTYNFLEFYPLLKFRHDYNLQEEFGKFIQARTEPDSYIIAMDEGPFIEYYGNRKILYKAIGLNKKDFEDFFRRVDGLLEKGDAIYIITSGIYGYDPKGYFRAALSKYKLTYLGSRLNEDWHHSTIRQVLFKESLFKIEKKG